MNDRDLDLALADLGAIRVHESAPPALRHHTRTMPLPPRRRGWFPTFDNRRFQSMFSAAKLVTAGAIVALFGGLLISGTLTGPTTDVAPPAAVSPSAEPSEVTPSVVPSSIDLELELTQDSPGVYRVMSDGIRDLSKDVSGVTVDVNGDVWVVKRQGPNDRRLVRLGEPGVARSVGSIPVLGSLGDGRPHLQSKEESVTLTDGAWVQSDRQTCAWREWTEVSVGGTCWGVDAETAGGSALYQLVDGEQQELGNAELGLSDGETIAAIDADGEGRIWAAVMGAASGTPYAFQGLVVGDGADWTNVPYMPEDPAVELGTPSEVAVGPDGIVWVVTQENSGLAATSWDGETWTSYGPVLPMFGRGETHFLPDGTIWFLEGAVVFDGTDLVRKTFPNLGALAFGQDGRAWTILDGGRLVVIDPTVLPADR